jgi:hypothetical protein
MSHMNLHYTWTSVSRSSGYTLDKPGYYPGNDTRADCIVVPGAFLDKHLEDGENFDDDFAGWLADQWEQEMGDDMPIWND